MHFQVKAMRGLSDVTILPVEAASPDEASAYAQRQGYGVLSVRRSRSYKLARSKTARRFSVIQFSQELIALQKAGLTVVEAIEILHRKEVDSSSKQVLAELLKRLRQGMRFSAALGDFPALFSPLYLATIRASERTSSVSSALERYVDYQGQIHKIRSKVVSASIYPAVLLAVGSLVVLFLLGYVLPRFSRIYEDIGGNLPVASQYLMQVGAFVGENQLFIFTGLIALAAAGYSARRNAHVQAKLVRLFWSLPVIGPKRRVYELAQFYRTISMLVRSGHTVLAALEMAAGMLSPLLRGKLAEAIVSVKQGRSFAVAMNAAGLATEVAHSMMMVSERSGSLSDMLDVVASFHEEELGRWIEWFSRLFEPILMAVLGIFIGLIVVFMYMPVFELAETIQ